jgi:hypothetical protein
MKFKKMALGLVLLIGAAVSQAQTTYNAVATAYVQTTITQSVVFDSTMQAGGTFTFSVLAHNGGGRQNQNDTANVKIQFYDSSNTLISSVNTNYSGNLPQPTASSNVNTQGVTLSGNPQADPAVPWTLLSVSSTNCGGSCANVAYAKVSMYGVDGSFWAGDYGPWYRAPTLTLDNSGNLLYNPEFGPYNGVNAQGWSISPALGACQGAWGGSNACIVDNNGTPGQNTVGLVANQGGGGPSATGGTTSGTAGGYNNTMSVTNPGPGTTGGSTPAPAPSGPVAVTNAAGTTDSNPSGTTTLTVTNAGTYTNNGTTGDVANTGTFTNNGTTGAVNNSGDFTNNTGATTGAVTNSGTFSNSGTTGAVTNNAGGLFTNNGTTGTVSNTNAIFTNNGTTGAVTNNNLGNFTNNGTVASVTDNVGLFTNNSTVTGGVINHGTFNNSGTVGGYFNNAGNLNNTGTLGTAGNSGNLNNLSGGVIDVLTYNNNQVYNHGTINSIVYNGGHLTNSSDGVIGSINNNEYWGSFQNDGTITGTVTTPSTFNNTGTIIGLYTNGGTLNNSGTTGDWLNNGTINNTGTMGNGTINGTFTNDGTVGDVVNNGIFDNNGTAGAVTLNTGSTFTNTGTAASVDNTAGLTFTNAGTITGLLTNAGDVTNTGTVGSVTNTGTYTNNGTTGDWLNNATMSNTGIMGNGTNTGTFTNTGTVGNVTNSGTFNYGGTVGGFTQTSTGTLNGVYGQVMAFNGPVSLDGNLIMSGTAPTTVGKYSVLTSTGLTGQFSSYTGVGVLRYTGTDVNLWIMPDGTIVQGQVNNLANSLSSMNALASGSLTGAVGSDCAAFGALGGCVSVNYGNTKVASGDLNSAGLTVAKKINNNWRVGVFAGQQLNSPTVAGVKFDSNTPAVGGFIGWNMNADGRGLGVTVSAVQGKGNYTIGNDKTSVDGQAQQIKGTYMFALNDTTSVTPYVGVRQSTFKINGFTQSGEVFPLTYSAVNQKTTDAIAGVSLGKQFTDKLSGNVSVGVVKNLSYSAGSVNATSDMGNFTAPLQGSKYTSTAFGAGLAYEVAKNQKIGVNFGWQQKSLTNANISSVGVSYTIGF